MVLIDLIKLTLYMCIITTYGEKKMPIGHDSKWILVHHRIGHTENKINNDKSIVHYWNILTVILNPTKRSKTKSHYSPLLKGRMNTRSGRALFRNFRILLDSGICSTITMGKLTEKLKPKNSTETMCESQVGKFTTSKKVNIYFCLPEFDATKLVTCRCQVAISTNSRYYMILGRYLLTALVLYLKFLENIILGGDGPFKGWSAPMVDISTYDFKPVTENKIKR